MTRLNEKMDVEVCVCTFRRPGVVDTLASIRATSVPPNVALSVLVVDNDINPTAQQAVERFAETSELDLRYVHCPSGNISIARNGALKHSTSRYLVFVDDDETVAQDWLLKLTAKARASGADVVLGPVDAIYGDFAPDWMKSDSVHSTRPVWVNGAITTGYTCNVLIDRSKPAVEDLTFDLDLGQSGGEDTKFFAQISRRGGKIAFAKDAMVYEPVPQERASFKWLAKRKFRAGQTHAHVTLGRGAAGGRLHLGLVAAAKALACVGLAALHLARPAKRNQAILRSMLHVGVVMGVLGMRELQQYGLKMGGLPQ